MKRKLRDLYWSMFGWPEYPPKDFEPKLKLVPKEAGGLIISKYYQMAYFYVNGVKPEDIAELFGVTRERVRQCLWKAYRQTK